MTSEEAFDCPLMPITVQINIFINPDETVPDVHAFQVPHKSPTLPNAADLRHPQA